MAKGNKKKPKISLFRWRIFGRGVKGHKTPDFARALHKGEVSRAKNRKKRKRKSN